MKPDQSEKILVEELFKKSISKQTILNEKIVNLEKLTGDASTRRYYRIYTQASSYVVCLDNPMASSQDEPSFIKLQKVLEKEGVRVPRIYDRELETGYILEEDLGDITFLKEIATIEDKKSEYVEYKQSLDLMASIHKINLGGYINESFTQMAFDHAKLFQEMEFTKKYFLKMYLNIDVESEECKKLYIALSEVCQKLSDLPRVLVHRDYHSRNIMIKNKEQIVIDFQDARLGTPLYDVVSLLEDCYYRIEDQNKLDLKNYYFENYYHVLYPNESKESFERAYNLMLIQRVFKAIGSFAYIYADRKDQRYIKYIGYAFENLRVTMAKVPELSSVRKILSSFYYAN